MGTFLSGQWNAICDVCGFQFKSGELRKRWDGAMVCAEDYETRHPQDLIRVRADKQSVAWSRPAPADTFLNVCTLWGTSGYAGIAEAGCMRAENTDHAYSFLVLLRGY